MHMVRLWPWLLVVALSACSSREEAEDGGLAKANLISLFEPAPAAGAPTIPFPFDGLFAGFTDPSLNIPNPANAPFVTAANLTDGFSTTATLFTDLLGFVDLSSALQGGLLIVDTSTGNLLVPGVDYTLTDYPAQAVIPNTNPPVSAPVNALRTRIMIHPLKPLKPSTRYLVAVTDNVRDLDGNRAVASSQFRMVRRDTPIAEQDDPSIAVLNATQRATLEVLRSQLIRPAVQGLLAATGGQLTEDNIVLAWTFTTQSVGKTLDRLAETATARPVVSAATGLNTMQLNPALPPVADVHIGRIDLPYFLPNSGGSPQSTDPLSGFWLADATRPDTAASFLGQVPCGAFVQPPPGSGFQPSVSTTTCFPVPVERSVETVSMLITVPNANSGQTRPASGWPVVIFQHGVTRNRTDMLAIAPALAAAGFVTVAIDLPLHGLPPGSPLAFPGATERTFFLDLVDNETSAPGPDGMPDPSGTHFVNLASLITSRDNLRQASIDLVHLARSVAQLNLDDDAMTTDINPDRLHLVGHSLGGIVGTTALALEDGFGASSLAMAGGGIAKLLDGSATFGPRIAAGLAASGIAEGSDTFETFIRFAQHLVDDGDPINYAGMAAAERALHFVEVLDDAVVPNAVPRSATAGAALHQVTLEGLLSGSTALMQQLGLDIREPITPPLETPTVLTGTALKVGVRFAVGDHGSILSPEASPAATQEIQRQIANFLASQGTCLPIGGSCNAP